MIALPSDRQFWDSIEHFEPWEFTCKCAFAGCELHGMDKAFVRTLDEFRGYCGFAFTVTSGYRCPAHPIEQKKLFPGPHQLGVATDIGIHGRALVTLLYNLGTFSEEWAQSMHRGVPFSGIGFNQKGDVDTRFLHLDRASNESYRTRPWTWTY